MMGSDSCIKSSPAHLTGLSGVKVLTLWAELALVALLMAFGLELAGFQIFMLK